MRLHRMVNLSGTTMKIAFIGIGNMGAPMARNLLRRGHSVTAFDVS
ncbi:NAD(P)-binding domain-containing protein, partial [Bacillus sp. SIMBA_074]